MKRSNLVHQNLPWPWEIIHDTQLILSKLYKVDSLNPPANPLRRILFASEKLPKSRFIQKIGGTLDRLEKRRPVKSEHSWWLIAHDLWKLARKFADDDSPHRRKRHHLAVVTQRGRAWRDHHSEQFLTPCARLVFDELCFRSGHNAWDIPIEKALKQNTVKFPWAFAGVESLIDSIPLHVGSEEKLVPYAEKQIRRSLKQLEQENRIKIFFRAFEGQGASRSWVFLTPEMSDTFKHLSRRNKALKILTDLQDKFKKGPTSHPGTKAAASRTPDNKHPVSLAQRRLELKKQAEKIKRDQPEDWDPPKKNS